MPFSLALPYAIMLATLPANAQQESVHQSGEVDLIQTGEDRHQRLTVPVSIGAVGPFEFMIDTGSQHTVLAGSLAGALGIPLARKAKLTGVAGSAMVDTVELDQISLGKRSYYGLLAPLLDR